MSWAFGGRSGRASDSIRGWAALASAAALLGACASVGGGMVLRPVEGQALQTVAGAPTVASVMANGRVMAAPLSVERGRVRFAVAVENLGPEPAPFGPGQVGLAADGLSMHLFSLAELEREAEAGANAEMLTAGLLGLGRAAMFSEMATSTTTLTAPSGVSVAVEHTDAALAAFGGAQAGAATSRAVDGIAEHRDGRVADLRARMLADVVVEPGAAHGGMVISDRVSPGADLVLTVRFAGERHEFRWRVAELP